jgi:hypothetical protein
VFEGILGLGIERLLIDELGIREGVESGGQVSIAEIAAA